LLAKSKSANQEIHENPLLWVLVLVPAVLLAKRIALAAHTLLFVPFRGKDRRCGRHQNPSFPGLHYLARKPRSPSDGLRPVFFSTGRLIQLFV